MSHDRDLVSGFKIRSQGASQKLETDETLNPGMEASSSGPQKTSGEEQQQKAQPDSSQEEKVASVENKTSEPKGAGLHMKDAVFHEDATFCTDKETSKVHLKGPEFHDEVTFDTDKNIYLENPRFLKKVHFKSGERPQAHGEKAQGTELDEIRKISDEHDKRLVEQEKLASDNKTQGDKTAHSLQMQKEKVKGHEAGLQDLNTRFEEMSTQIKNLELKQVAEENATKTEALETTMNQQERVVTGIQKDVQDLRKDQTMQTLKQKSDVEALHAEMGQIKQVTEEGVSKIVILETVTKQQGEEVTKLKENVQNLQEGQMEQKELTEENASKIGALETVTKQQGEEVTKLKEDVQNLQEGQKEQKEQAELRDWINQQNEKMKEGKVSQWACFKDLEKRTPLTVGIFAEIRGKETYARKSTLCKLNQLREERGTCKFDKEMGVFTVPQEGLYCVCVSVELHRDVKVTAQVLCRKSSSTESEELVTVCWVNPETKQGENKARCAIGCMRMTRGDEVFVDIACEDSPFVYFFSHTGLFCFLISP